MPSKRRSVHSSPGVVSKADSTPLSPPPPASPPHPTSASELPLLYSDGPLASAADLPLSSTGGPEALGELDNFSFISPEKVVPSFAFNHTPMKRTLFQSRSPFWTSSPLPGASSSHSHSHAHSSHSHSHSHVASHPTGFSPSPRTPSKFVSRTGPQLSPAVGDSTEFLAPSDAHSHSHPHVDPKSLASPSAFSPFAVPASPIRPPRSRASSRRKSPPETPAPASSSSDLLNSGSHSNSDSSSGSGSGSGGSNRSAVQKSFKLKGQRLDLNFSSVSVDSKPIDAPASSFIIGPGGELGLDDGSTAAAEPKSFPGSGSGSIRGSSSTVQPYFPSISFSPVVGFTRSPGASQSQTHSPLNLHYLSPSLTPARFSRFSSRLPGRLNYSNPSPSTGDGASPFRSQLKLSSNSPSSPSSGEQLSLIDSALEEEEFSGRPGGAGVFQPPSNENFVVSLSPTKTPVQPSDASASAASTAPAPAAVHRPCNCKKSKCLKLYCECFARGAFCVDCNCVGCANIPKHKEQRDKAVGATLERDSNAFFRSTSDASAPVESSQGHPNSNSHSAAFFAKKVRKGCNCKKSECLKKYCECFQAGIPCSDLCKCVECRNGHPGSKDKCHKHSEVPVNDGSNGSAVPMGYALASSGHEHHQHSHAHSHHSDSIPPLESPPSSQGYSPSPGVPSAIQPADAAVAQRSNGGREAASAGLDSPVDGSFGGAENGLHSLDDGALIKRPRLDSHLQSMGGLGMTQ